MKRFLGHCMAGAAVLVAAATAAPACVHNDKSLFINGVMTPPTPAQTGACLYTADPTAAHLPSGTMDIAFTSTYEAFLLVGNQLAVRASAEQNRSESSRVILQGATVRVTDATGTELSSFTRLGSGIVEPASGVLPSYGLIQTVLVDPTSAAYVAKTIPPNTVKRVISYVRVFGETLGGESVESQEYSFPVDVCFRCLVRFTPDTEDKALSALLNGQPNCLAAAGATAVKPCQLGADDQFSCSVCQDLPACDPTYSGTAQTPGTVKSQIPPDAGGG